MAQFNNKASGAFPTSRTPGMHSQPPVGVTAQPSFPPVPPPHAVPRDLRPRLLNGMSDIRSENLDQSAARVRLSTVIVVRLQPASSRFDYDYEGYRKEPSWEKVTWTELKEMPQRDARRRVRQLEETTGPVFGKKRRYPLSIQRQIEKTLEELENSDPDTRYSYQLVQVESTYSSVGDRLIEHASKHGRDKYGTDGKYSKSSKRSKSSKSSKSSRSSKSSKSSKRSRSESKGERVAVTAYFMRIPASNQSPLRMLEEEEREQRMAQRARMMPSFQQAYPPQIHASFPQMNYQAGPAQLAHPGPFAVPKQDVHARAPKPVVHPKHEQPVQQKPSYPGVFQQQPRQAVAPQPNNEHKPAGPIPIPPAKPAVVPTGSHLSGVIPTKVNGVPGGSRPQTARPAQPAQPAQVAPGVQQTSNQPPIKGLAMPMNIVRPPSNQTPSRGPVMPVNMVPPPPPPPTLPARGLSTNPNIGMSRKPQVDMPPNQAPAGNFQRPNMIPAKAAMGTGSVKTVPIVVTTTQEPRKKVHLDSDDSSSFYSDDDWSANEDEDTEPSSLGSVQAFSHRGRERSATRRREDGYDTRRTHRRSTEGAVYVHNRGRQSQAPATQKSSTRGLPMERREVLRGRLDSSRRHVEPDRRNSSRRDDSISPKRSSFPRRQEEEKWSSWPQRRPEPARFRHSVRIVAAPADTGRDFRGGRDSANDWMERKRLDEAARNRMVLENAKRFGHLEGGRPSRGRGGIDFEYDDEEARRPEFDTKERRCYRDSSSRPSTVPLRFSERPDSRRND